MKSRIEQLPASYYNRALSKVLYSYYKAFDHPLKLRLLRFIENILGQKRIIAKTNSGFYMAVDQADLLQRQVFYEGIYEERLTRLLEGELKEEDIFFDIGANIGYYTCLALSFGVEKVFAFEADPLDCDILNVNVKLNGFDQKRIKIVQKGIGEKSGLGHFKRTHVANTGLSGFEASNAVSSFDVEIDTLDHLQTSGCITIPTVMKIDIEGWEYQALKGAQIMLEHSPPRLIIFETECTSYGEIINENLAKMLEGLGYRISLLPEKNRESENRQNYVARYKA